MTQFGERPKVDYWSTKLDDRRSVTVRFHDKWKPVGDAGIASFCTLVTTLSGREVPTIVDHYNCALSSRPFQDTRFVFDTPVESKAFVDILDQVPFSKLKILNICYVDRAASLTRLDNSSCRVMVECEHGQKTKKVISRAQDEGSVTLRLYDPFARLLTTLNRRDSTPEDFRTPLHSPLESPEADRDRAKRTSGSSVASLLNDDGSGVKKKKQQLMNTESLVDDKKARLAKKDNKSLMDGTSQGTMISHQSEVGDAVATRDNVKVVVPSTRELTIERVGTLTERLHKLVKNEYSELSLDQKKSAAKKWKQERGELQSVLDQHDAFEGLFTWEEILRLY